MVDWSGKLEAVHTDGRVVRTTLVETDMDSHEMCRRVDEALDSGFTLWFRNDGTHSRGQWTIRNVVNKAAWRTSDEQLDRMDALVQRLARHKDDTSGAEARNARQEARDILAAREPVDPDIAIAQQICDRSPYNLTGLNDQRVTRTNEQIREAVLAGIKYGRAQA